MSKFSERFRLLKSENGGKTLKELSKDLNITAPNLSYYMSGREPSYDILIRIADYFDVTTDWLIGRTDARDSTQTSILSEIEESLDVDEKDRLAGIKSDEYSNDQSILYLTMTNTYGLFRIFDDKTCRQINSLINTIFLSVYLYIREMLFDAVELSKDNILHLLKTANIYADTLQTLVLLSAHEYALMLATDEDISEEERLNILDIIKLPFDNFKDLHSEENINAIIDRIHKLNIADIERADNFDGLQDDPD